MSQRWGDIWPLHQTSCPNNAACYQSEWCPQLGFSRLCTVLWSAVVELQHLWCGDYVRHNGDTWIQYTVKAVEEGYFSNADLKARSVKVQCVISVRPNRMIVFKLVSRTTPLVCYWLVKRVATPPNPHHWLSQCCYAGWSECSNKKNNVLTEGKVFTFW